MVLKWFPAKDPDEVLDYQVVWTGSLEEGDTIATSAWSFVAPVDGALVIDSDTFGETTTTIWLSGGTLGKYHTLLNRITTVGGRTMDQTVRIGIRSK